MNSQKKKHHFPNLNLNRIPAVMICTISSLTWRQTRGEIIQNEIKDNPQLDLREPNEWSSAKHPI